MTKSFYIVAIFCQWSFSRQSVMMKYWALQRFLTEELTTSHKINTSWSKRVCHLWFPIPAISKGQRNSDVEWSPPSKTLNVILVVQSFSRLVGLFGTSRNTPQEKLRRCCVTFWGHLLRKGMSSLKEQGRHETRSCFSSLSEKVFCFREEIWIFDHTKKNVFINTSSCSLIKL